MEREPILKCPKCGFPFFGPRKTDKAYEARIRKVWFHKPYFFNLPVPEEFEFPCPKCGKSCHVKMEPPASMSFLMRYMRRIIYHWEKIQAKKSKRRKH